ncbi:MAG: phasin family protein [Rhodomicrobium sp.]
MAENPVEIPQAMREQAEQNIKQAHAAYEQLTDFVTKAMDAWMGAMPANPMVAGFKEVQGRAAEIAMENAESAFTFAGKMSNVRTPQDIVTLQTQLVQDRMQAFATQTQQLFSVIRRSHPEVRSAPKL